MPLRCFLGCPRESAGHLHSFPNSDRFPEQFKKWVQVVGGELNTSDDYAFYRKKRICDRHFTVKDQNRCNRLNALAVPSLSDVTTTIEIIEPSTAVESEPAVNSTVVDMEEDPLKITEDPISYSRIIEDVPFPQTPEGISCPSPIMDVPSPQAEEVTISCTSPIVDNSPPKPTVAQQALYRVSDAFTALKHTSSKFQVIEKCNVAASHSEFQGPEKCNVAGCDVYKENVLVSLSDYHKCQQRQIRLLKQQVSSLKKRCISYKNRLAQASKPSVAFQKVTKNMTEPAKLFMKMQFTQTHKKPGGRRFSSEEKKFSLCLYRTSPQSYSFLANYFTLPSVKLIKALLAQEKLEPYLTLDKNATLPSKKTLIQEKLEPYLTLEKNCTLPPKITLKDVLARDNFEPYLTLEQNSSLPLRITLKDILAHKQLEPYLTLKKTTTSPSIKTRAKEKPEPHHTLKRKSNFPTKKALKGILAQEKLEPYLTLDKNASLPSNKTLIQEKLEPYLTLEKNCTLPPKITLKDVLARENFEPYLTLEQNSSLPLRITLKDILAHKQPEPYLTLKKTTKSPSIKTRAKEKPEPHHTLKRKSTLPTKKALKGILAQENLEPYLTFNKSLTKTYPGKGKARTEAE